jgi:uncharacterized RmlC-like cupin family protein
MHTHSIDNVSPITTPHGELIRELIGRTATEGSAPRHSVAHIVLPPGKSSLLHYHPEAEESYYILSGQARVLIGEEEVVMVAGTAVLIPPPNPTKSPTSAAMTWPFWPSAYRPGSRTIPSFWKNQPSGILNQP